MNLKHYRTDAGLTQKSLAEKAGLSRAYINQLESGRSKAPSVQVALKLADTLGVTVEELFEHKAEVKCPEKTPVEILGWAISELKKLSDF